MVSLASVFPDPTTSIVAALVTLVLLWIYTTRTNNFPPGPYGLPLVGYAPFLGKNPGEALMKLKKKYGSVMSVQMGRQTWVVLNDYQTIHEAFVKNGDKFSGRPSNFIFDAFYQRQGFITVEYGPTWKSMRKFGSVALRGLGVGTKGMEDKIIEEASYLIENLTNANGQTHRHKIMMAVANVISRVAVGSRFEYDDERFRALLKVLEDFFTDTGAAKLVGVLMFAPFLRHFPIFRGALKKILQERAEFDGIVEEFIKEHKSSFTKDDPRDFIDLFLEVIMENGGEDARFNQRQLSAYIRDIFEAGSGTTSSTLHWCIFTMCHFPGSQEKIAEEIESVIGLSGTPAMEHRKAMPYTCAFIHEVMRLKTLAPLGVFHKTTEDSTLNGYNIPKNTTVAPNLWAVHHDPNTFPNPVTFRPERFIDNDGNFAASNFVIPFSVGLRYCLGEQLAKTELFLFLTSIVQKFEIRPDPKSKLPEFENSGESTGLSFEAPDFDVIFHKR